MTETIGPPQDCTVGSKRRQVRTATQPDTANPERMQSALKQPLAGQSETTAGASEFEAIPTDFVSLVQGGDMLWKPRLSQNANFAWRD